MGIKNFEINIITSLFQKPAQITVSLHNMKKIIPVEEGDYYLTPEGYRCFTEQYHLKRGYCCKSGCRHCPYAYDKKTDSFKS
ncbi:hypothetical protein BKP44_01580 [Formosa algae]|nr:hypothetical protein BKP44_01580 [Formosa algae]